MGAWRGITYPAAVGGGGRRVLRVLGLVGIHCDGKVPGVGSG